MFSQIAIIQINVACRIFHSLAIRANHPPTLIKPHSKNLACIPALLGKRLRIDDVDAAHDQSHMVLVIKKGPRQRVLFRIIAIHLCLLRISGFGLDSGIKSLFHASLVFLGGFRAF
ncbi:uncharacterized protein N7458_000279 [Penicillium daleae]|uniref:Uncharacterized protein n=1 Tax=Penicillium daleae TaxID=63821 RepID=A0AAD6G799_9EURO|nr:uncharacterized protein N7458_000279 [Penicillium daleae]KAJ5464593.1 hypothetical protein N7458_000279 [Penicillium daleae]